MRKKLCALMCLGMVMAPLGGPSAFAEGLDGVSGQVSESEKKDPALLEKDQAPWDTVVSGKWGDLASAPEFATVKSISESDESWKDDANLYLADSFLENSLTYAESAVADEFVHEPATSHIEPGIIVGLKYTFKRFKLHRFKKAVFSFFGNINKSSSERTPSVAFYFDVP